MRRPESYVANHQMKRQPGKAATDRGPLKQNEWRVFVTRPIAEQSLRRLASQVRVDLWDDDQPPGPDELRTRAREADGVLSMVTDRFDSGTIRALSRLRAISNLAVGLDNI